MKKSRNSSRLSFPSLILICLVSIAYTFAKIIKKKQQTDNKKAFTLARGQVERSRWEKKKIGNKEIDSTRVKLEITENSLCRLGH